nr:HutD family protein [Gluconobacter cerinus]
MLTIASVASFPAQPWRNGRGMTRVIATGADWRISLADIQTDGPFSVFPGLTRSLLLAAGARLTLHGLSPAPQDLRALGQSVCFKGEMPVSACCHGAPVQALNLMVRSEKAACLACFHGPVVLPAQARFCLLPLSGSWRIETIQKPVSCGFVVDGASDERPICVSPDHGAPGCLMAVVFIESKSLKDMS